MADFKDRYSLELTKTIKNMVRFAAVYKTLSSVIKASTEQFLINEDATKRLERSLRAVGLNTPGVVDALTRQARAMSEITVASEATVTGMQSMLVAMGVTPDKVGAATKAALGFSNAFGKSAKEAAVGIAKALKGNFDVLRENGVLIDRNRDTMTQLTDQFGRFAESSGSVSDNLSILKNDFDDVLAGLGKATLDGFAAAGGMSALTQSVKGMKTAIADGTVIDFFKVMFGGGEGVATRREGPTEVLRVQVKELGEVVDALRNQRAEALKTFSALDPLLQKVAARSETFGVSDAQIARAQSQFDKMKQVLKDAQRAEGQRILAAKQKRDADLAHALKVAEERAEIERRRIQRELARKAALRKDAADERALARGIDEFWRDARRQRERELAEHERRKLQIVSAAQDKVTDLALRRIELEQKTAEGQAAIQDKQAAVAADMVKSFEDAGKGALGALGNIAAGMAQAAANGEDMGAALLRQIGQQLVAMGTMWTISAPVSLLTPGSQPLGVVQAIAGPAAIAAGIAMGAAAGPASGSGGGRSATSTGGRSAGNFRPSFDDDTRSSFDVGSDAPAVTQIFLQGGAGLYTEQNLQREVDRGRRNRMTGLRTGVFPKRAFAA